uniref:ABC-type xenobiotic transporter n=1 Tax=Diabrotica virgifera virgifera TaxID=50390 RepID=A0A6P7GJZ3_DIAVI
MTKTPNKENASFLVCAVQAISWCSHFLYTVGLRSRLGKSQRGPTAMGIVWCMVFAMTIVSLRSAYLENSQRPTENTKLELGITLYYTVLQIIYALSLIPGGSTTTLHFPERYTEITERQPLINANAYGRFSEEGDPNDLGIALEDTNWLSRLSFSWVKSLVNKGIEDKIVTSDDLYDLPDSISSDNNSNRLENYLRIEHAAICDSHFNFKMSVIGLKMRGAIINTIYRKTLSVRSTVLMSKLSVGEIMNYMSTDTDRIVNSCPSFHAVWSIPFQLFVSLYLLYNQVGLAFLAGVMFSIILIPINKCIANKIGDLSTKMMEQKDGRVKLTSEILRGIKAIKLYVWEQHFIRLITSKPVDVLRNIDDTLPVDLELEDSLQSEYTSSECTLENSLFVDNAQEKDKDIELFKEVSERGNLDFTVIISYWKAISHFVSISILISMTLMQVSRNFTDWWLANGVTSPVTNSTNLTVYLATATDYIDYVEDDDNMSEFLKVYVELACVNTLFTLIRSFIFAYGGILAATKFHKVLLKTVLRVRLTTIRAMRVIHKFKHDNNQHLEANLKAQFASQAAARWLGLRLQFIGVIIITGVSFIAVIQHQYDIADPGFVSRGKLQRYCIITRNVVSLLLMFYPIMHAYNTIMTKTPNKENASFLVCAVQAISWCSHFLYTVGLRSRLGKSQRGPTAMGIVWCMVFAMTIVSLRSAYLENSQRPTENTKMELGITLYYTVLQIIYALSLIPGGSTTTLNFPERYTEITERQPLINANAYGRFSEEGDPNDLGVAMEDTNWLSRLSFSWVKSLVNKGVEDKIVTSDDLYDLPDSISSDNNSNRLENYLRIEHDTDSSREVIVIQPRKSSSLLAALHRCYAWQFYSVGILRLVADCSNFAGPILLNKLVDFIEKRSIDIKWGYLYAVLLVLPYMNLNEIYDHKELEDNTDQNTEISISNASFSWEKATPVVQVPKGKGKGKRTLSKRGQGESSVQRRETIIFKLRDITLKIKKVSKQDVKKIVDPVTVGLNQPLLFTTFILGKPVDVLRNIDDTLPVDLELEDSIQSEYTSSECTLENSLCVDNAQEKDKDIELFKEVSERGNLDFTVIISYWKGISHFVSISILISMTLMQVSRNFTDWWLANGVTSPVTNSTNLTVYLATATDYIDYVEDDDNMSEFLKVYVELACVNTLFTLIRSFIFAYGGILAATKFHKVLLKTVLRARCTFFDVTPIGRIINRFSSDTYTVDDSLPFILNIFLAQLFGLLGSLFITMYGLPWICVFLIPLVPIYTYLLNQYRITSRELKRISSVTLSPIYNHFTELPIDFAIASDIRFSHFGLHGFQRFIGLAISYALGITGSLSGVVNSFTETEREMVAVERINQYVESIPMESKYFVMDPPFAWPSQGVISFEHVTLHYRKHLPPSLMNLSFDTRPYEKLGVVGRTGAGKSSIISVLFNLVDITAGVITIDAVDIKKISLATLRSRMFCIPQDPFLFSGTLKENLDPLEEFKDDEIWNALGRVNLTDVINSLGGLDYKIDGSGSNFSVGQKQLVCLARAVLHNAKILCIDEATANVDEETDRLIQNTIRTAFRSSTVITIAHRIQTIFDSDRVLVMHQGEVVEFDKPDVLMADSSTYFYRLVQEA